MVGEQSPQKQALLAAWDAAWEHGELSRLRGLLSAGYRRYSPRAPRGETAEQMFATIATTRAAFPDLRTVVDDAVEENDTIAVRWHSSGTHTGALGDVPPTGRAVTASGVDFARFENRLIVAEWVTSSPFALLAAAGVIALESLAS